MKHPWSQLSGLPRPVWVLFGATLVNRCGTMVLPFMVLYLTRSLGLPPRRAALALAAYGLGAVLTAPVSGRLADRIGARRVIVASLLGSATLLSIFPLAHTLRSILILTFIWSMLGEAVRPASLAWMSDLVPPDRRRAGFALTRLAVNLGMSLGPAVAGFVVQFSFTAIFILDAATSLAAAALLLIATRGVAGGDARGATATAPGPDAGPPAPPAEAEVAPNAPTADAPAAVATAAVATIPAAAGPAPDRRAHRDPRFLFFLAAILPAQVVFFQHTAVLPLFLTRDLGLAEAAYGLMFTINTMLVIFVEVPLNSATSRWSHRQSLALGALLVGAGFGGLSIVHGFPGVAAMVVVWTFGEMILLPGSAAFVADASPPARRGEYLGLYSMSFSIAFAIAPWLGAQAMENLGTRAVWVAACACGVLSAGLVTFLRPDGPSPAAAPGTPPAAGV
jgi:predicted MFS family arabinose efflux permease